MQRTYFERVSLYFSEDNTKTRKERPKLVKYKPVSSDNTPVTKPMKASNVLFLGLFWAIGVVCIINNLWIMELLTIPFAIYLIKKFLAYFGTDNFLYQHAESIHATLKQWSKDREDVLAPAPVRGLVRTAMLGDKKVVC